MNRRAIALTLLVAFSLLESGGASALGDPIEATWGNAAGSAVAVAATSATHFVGTATAGWTVGGCTYSAGQVVWDFDKRLESDGIYRGVVHGCTGDVTSTWMVYGSTLQLCVVEGPCETDTRLSAPPPPPPPPAPLPVLRATVSASGATTINARTAVAGPYVLDVTDRSAKGNFHLVGSGVNRRTGVTFEGTVEWKLQLVAGVYRYGSDTSKKRRHVLVVR
jgi:hypothetical protein